jgi:hypothetical protein
MAPSAFGWLLAALHSVVPSLSLRTVFLGDRLESTPSARDLPGSVDARGLAFRIGCR